MTMMYPSWWNMMKPWIWVAFGLTAIFLASCEKRSDLDDRMSYLQGDYYLDAEEGTWHCPDGSLSDRLLDAKLEKVGNLWVFEYYIPLKNSNSWTTCRICQPVSWDPLTGSYYFTPLTMDDLPRALSNVNLNNWSYSFQYGRIGIVAGSIHLNWTRR